MVAKSAGICMWVTKRMAFVGPAWPATGRTRHRGSNIHMSRRAQASSDNLPPWKYRWVFMLIESALVSHSSFMAKENGLYKALPVTAGGQGGEESFTFGI